MGKKWIQWLSWGGGRSGRETVKHSSEVNRKVSTSSAQPLFELDLKPTLSRDEGPSQPGVISNSEATTTNSQATTTDSQASRKESINSINSMHPLLVEYENEHTRRVSLQEPQNLPSIPDSEVENASIPQAEYEDGKRYKDEPEIVTNKEFSSGSEARKWMYKNVIGVGLSFLLVFSAFLGLQNLQSSINAAGGLGLASLGILYLFFTISGFVTPGILKLLGTKYSLLGGFLCHLVYTAANYYPSWYTLVPASALLGFASGPIWAAANTHLVKVAVASAPWLEMDQNHLIGYIVGIFFGFFQGAQIPGNLASSLIFYPYSNNETGLDYYNTDNGVDNASTQHCRVNEDQVLDRIFLYILSSVYLVMVTVGILALVALVDRFPIAKEKNRSVAHTLKMYFGSPFIDLLKMMKNYKMILLVPIATVNGLVQAFIFGTFTQAIIAECFGTYLVGFALIVHGVTSATAGMTYGQLVKCIPRYSLFVFGGLINIGLLIFLVLWTPYPTYVAVFLFVFFWGVADAVWNAMTASLVGILFPGESELAYSVHRIWLAIGLGIGFIIGEFLHLQGRCYFMLAAITIAVISNLVLEFKTQSRATLLPCCKSANYSISSKQVSKVGNDHAKA